jgi:hypothetical protein
MHPEILEGPQKSLLALLGRGAIPPGFYVAGGTGLALHLGHRKSVDLDLFCPEAFEIADLLTFLRGVGEVQLRRNDPGALTARVEGVEVSFIRYQYPMLDPPVKLELGPPIAQVRDIACMKLSAIMSRGSRRDFVDLYTVCGHGHTLAQVYGWFQQKYHGISYDPYHLAKSLVYFLDAEEERMPVMLWPCHWEDVKTFFVRESQRAFGG